MRLKQTDYTFTWASIIHVVCHGAICIEMCIRDSASVGHDPSQRRGFISRPFYLRPEGDLHIHRCPHLRQMGTTQEIVAGGQ